MVASWKLLFLSLTLSIQYLYAQNEESSNEVSWSDRNKFIKYWLEFDKYARKISPDTDYRTRKRPPIIVEGDIATNREENLFRLGLLLNIRQKSTTLYKIHSNYLYIHPSKIKPGCWSFVGKQGGRQDLSLRRPTKKSCYCLCNSGRILHEVLHALGFYHEHSRPDRDKFIEIVSSNVQKGKLQNFSKKTFDKRSLSFTYDYNSIMHYGSLSFSKDKIRRKKRQFAL
ncbi:unnamed protein product [Lepeophtheirus salmonis]|uniref:Metalloendopeptidase n=1 Tax=Lepeophtheirus salmonis TaxID=72036 RepID=A0A7R8CAF6_LEPSM|nr:unnamed protein product [Lepeophtheirus salmonis]CAF2750609.1 unnamed protein product [Lepeophtheirus salmonis]